MKVLDQETRRLILQLHERGVGMRQIARLVGHSRPAVTRVVASSSEVPQETGRASMLDEHRGEILRLVGACRGNLVRVHEGLLAAGVKHGYTTLTDYVSKHNLKKPPQEPSGRYHFEAGEEMQFDSSCHRVHFNEGPQKYQCASLVLCFSRMWYFQYYRRFTRLECKSFLTKAVMYFGGACKRCMIDNTNLVVLHGTGADAVITPEMVDFARRFGFSFVAHRIGDANRSARVERRFHMAENNFLAGRVFADPAELNQRAAEFCDRINNKWNRRLKTAPAQLHASEQQAMAPLPPLIPEVYRLVYRVVDVEGFVHLDRNIYSVPYNLIGRQVELRESLERIRVYDGPREVAVHERLVPGSGQRMTDKAHRPQRSLAGRRSEQPLPEEKKLREADPLLAAYVDRLRMKAPGRGAVLVRRLHRLYNEYPTDVVLAAVKEAEKYGMADLTRLETMVLRTLGGRFFADDGKDNGEEAHE